MKVLMVGVTDRPCGTRGYSQGLKERLEPSIEIEEVSLFDPPEELLSDHKFDILHLNFAENAPYGEWIPFLSSIPRKVWTFHHARESVYERHPTYPIEPHEWFSQFDRVIVNQPLTGASFKLAWNPPEVLSMAESGHFVYIPQPIPHAMGQSKPGKILRIASHGFPTRFKRMREICEAAAMIKECEVHLMCARSPHVDVDAEEGIFRQILGDVPLIMDKEFLTVERIIENFQRAHVGVFSAIPSQGGQSAAILPAVAAGTPLVVSDSWHFNTIKPYAMIMDANDFLDEARLAQSITIAAHLPASVPPIVEEMSWERVAEMHKEVYQDVFNSP